MRTNNEAIKTVRLLSIKILLRLPNGSALSGRRWRMRPVDTR